VIHRGDGRVLVTRRPPDRHMAGLWEFPGGAVEEGERAEDALARELLEELGVVITVENPLTFAWHREPGREILLLFYRARLDSGVPTALEGQQIAWVTPGELSRLSTPPADAALVVQLTGTPAAQQ